MCTVLAASIAIGVAQTGIGIMQAKEEAAYANAVAKSKYLHAKQAAERNNQLAIQSYNNQLRIAEDKDRVKKEAYENEIKAFEAALLANNDKSKANALEVNRAAAEVAAKKRGADIEAAFKIEENVAQMIKAQGQLLATGGSGQSFLLQTEDPLRILGMAQERVGETLYNTHQRLNLELQGVGMDYVSSEWAAFNSLPPAPLAQRASLLPFEPMMDPGPGKPIKRSANYAPAVMSGISTGISAGFGLSGGEPISEWGGITI